MAISLAVTTVSGKNSIKLCPIIIRCNSQLKNREQKKACFPKTKTYNFQSQTLPKCRRTKIALKLYNYLKRPGSSQPPTRYLSPSRICLVYIIIDCSLSLRGPHLFLRSCVRLPPGTYNHCNHYKLHIPRSFAPSKS